MPFTTSADIRAEIADTAARAARLQEALDHTHKILDVLDDDSVAGYESVAIAGRLRDSLNASLHAAANVAKVKDGILRRVLDEEAAGISDPETGVPVRNT